MAAVWRRLRAAGGLVGPVAFTAAWVLGGRRQEGYAPASEHLSGLAAADARDPHLLVGGFLLLGTGTVAFGSALDEALGGPRRAGSGPLLVKAAGVSLVAAGLLRRDHLLLSPPGEPLPPSWRNDGHDAASAVVYGCLVAAPLALSRRMRADPGWTRLAPAAAVLALVDAALLACFASRRFARYGGVLQRIAVSAPAAAMAAVSARLLHQQPDGSGPARPARAS